MEKIARICWNDNKWSRPSGTNGKSTSKNTFESQYGYGHEEWLLDKSRIIDGYHYGSLQTLSLKTNKHFGKIYNVWLYTISGKQKFLVGRIENAICISKTKSKEIYQKYLRNGWIKEMSEELETAGINSKRFRETPDVDFFNLKFKVRDFKCKDKENSYEKISHNDKNITTTRYRLLNKISNFIIEDVNVNGKDKYPRKAIPETTVDPYHRNMQIILADIINLNGEFHNIKVEYQNVDVQATSNNGQLHFFEIKTDTPKNNIRLALGQLFEYSLFPKVNIAQKLIIVGDEEPSNEVKKYLNHLREKTGLPIFYRWIDMEKKMLSKEI